MWIRGKAVTDKQFELKIRLDYIFLNFNKTTFKAILTNLSVLTKIEQRIVGGYKLALRRNLKF